MQHLSLAMFASPTGARTDTKISPASATLVGAEHHVLGVGWRRPKSAFPWKKGRPIPDTLYVSDSGDWPIVIAETSGSPSRRVVQQTIADWGRQTLFSVTIDPRFESRSGASAAEGAA